MVEREVRGIRLKVRDDVYDPAEDTLLLLDALEDQELRGKRCLDVGTGSGVIAIRLAKECEFTVAVDLLEAPALLAKENSKINGVYLEVVQGDVLTAFREGSFDVVTFNPPYLPEDPDPSSGITYSWAGGFMGREPLDRFLADLPRVLKVGGLGLFLFSDLNDSEWVLRTCNKKMVCEVVRRRKLSFHEIYVARAQNLPR